MYKYLIFVFSIIVTLSQILYAQTVKTFSIKSKQIQILDQNKNKIDYISLDPQVTFSTKPYTKEDSSSRIIKVREKTENNPFVSKNGQYAGICINNMIMSYFDENGEEVFENYDRAGTGKVVLMDSEKKILWEYYQFPEGTICYGCHKETISDNADTTVIQTGSTTSESEENDGTIFVFNKEGKIILRISNGINVVLSPNGKYLSVDVPGKKDYSTLFYDLEKLSNWVPDKQYTVYSISDKGIFECNLKNQSLPVYELDLNNLIKK